LKCHKEGKGGASGAKEAEGKEKYFSDTEEMVKGKRGRFSGSMNRPVVTRRRGLNNTKRTEGLGGRRKERAAIRTLRTKKKKHRETKGVSIRR